MRDGRRHKWVGVLAATVILGAAWRAPAIEDEVKLANNKGSQRGTVMKDTVEGVELKMGNGKMTFPPGEITDVVYDIGNYEWSQGMRDFQNGDYAGAAQAFQALYNDADQMKTFRSVAKPYLAYLVGESLYRSGRHQDAVTAFEMFMKEHRDSRYVPMAVGSLVDAAIQAKKYSMVPPLLEKLKALGAENAAKANLFGAELDLAQGNPGAAEGKFNQAASASSNPETQALARLGLARCAVEKKESDKAKKMAEAALKSSSSPAVAGTAYLIIGDVLFAEAEATKGEPAMEKLIDASLAYLRIPVLYPGDRRTEPEALYKAGECFKRLAKFPNRGKDRNRAKAMYSTVIERYGSSRWGKDAREGLKTIR